MYFETNEVNFLICQHCQAQLEGPKILPCGETICSYCVSLIQTNLNIFDCLVCKQQHEMPKNGLIENKVVLKMLSVQPNRVSLMKLLNEIHKKRDLIITSLGINNRSHFVKEHFMDLRNDVQLAAEQVILQVNDVSSKLIEEIDQYEKELIEYNDTNSKSLDEFNKLALELKSFHSLNIEYLKQQTVDDQVVKNSIKETIRLIQKTDLDIQNLKDILFNGYIFKFEKNSERINESILGIIKKVNLTRMDSIILSDRDQIKDLIRLCDFQSSKKYNLIYRASQDGFEANDFHSKCDQKPNTLIIIKSEHGNIFGGYTEQDWSGNGYRNDPKSFIFSFVNQMNFAPLKMKCSSNKSIYSSQSYGPIFGSGPAFRIHHNSNQNRESFSSLGITSCNFKQLYYADNSIQAKYFLAGSPNFKVLEIEAYTLE